MAAQTLQPQTGPATNHAPAPLPRHVAIIMDGNGRWAIQRGRDRTYGHRCGAEAVRDIVIECAKLGIEALTLYSFSTENWTRSREEIECLMDLYIQYLISERKLFTDNNVRLRQIGRRTGLPAKVLDELDQTIELTREHTGMSLCLAINYGSRAEITDAVRSIARQVQAGQLTPDQITPQTITDHLYTVGLPDPDLLIRTAGEQRLSNYLLWQLSYAEFYVDEICWPQFTTDRLYHALREFANRRRKFGGVASTG